MRNVSKHLGKNQLNYNKIIGNSFGFKNNEINRLLIIVINK